ncbi:hypothetical protein Tco_0915918 [Tanacetum coccineum]
MESSTSSQPNQPYSPINPTNLDMNFEELIFSQDYNYSQDYSMGHGSGHGSAPVQNEEDDSPVEEVSPVKPKKPSRRAARAKKDEPKEPPKDWTIAEETALCQAWCDVSENNIDGNSWKDVEMPAFYNTQGRKKSKTSETTSGSASGGLNLNEKADEGVEETQEFRTMGRDREKAKKKATGSSRGGSSLFVDLLSIREAEAREIAQLKREKLEIQRRTLELAEKEKRDRDILFYNSLEMKMEIKERYNLDY